MNPQSNTNAEVAAVATFVTPLLQTETSAVMAVAFIRLFVRACVHSFVRSFVRSFTQLIRIFP